MKNLVETDFLNTHLENPKLRVLDCTAYLPNYFDESAAEKIEILGGREHWERGHIPGSAFADLLDELSDHTNTSFMFPMPSAEAFSKAMSLYGVDNESFVVLYDERFNVWAARVWWMLKVYGFSNAFILNGGWKKWISEGRPVSTSPPSYPHATFLPEIRSELIATKADVVSSLYKSDVSLVNALDSAEFAGCEPVRYRRAGHIPSSVNVPYLDLVDTDSHTFRSEDELYKAFRRVGSFSKMKIITYCGGAIAASGDAFVLSSLGCQNVSVYEGSLTEWTGDPSLPLVY